MQQVTIVTDGSCELPGNLVSQYGIHVIPINVIFEESKESYQLVGLDGEITLGEFYQKIKKELPTTGLPDSQVFYDVFMKAAEETESVIVITATSKLSKIHLHAKATISGIHDKDITLIDSRTAGSTLGLLVIEAAKMAQNGSSKDEILSRIHSLMPKVAHINVIDDMSNIYRAGRMGWLSKQLGQMMQVKPVLIMRDGTSISAGRFRGRKEVIERLCTIGSHACENALTDYIIVWHTKYQEGANKILEVMQQNNVNNKEILVLEGGPLFAGFTGEKSIGVMYLGKFDEALLQ